MASQGAAELSQAFNVLQRAVQATAQGTPAILQVLEGLATRIDRMILLQERQLASTMASEAMITRSANIQACWLRKDGPYKIVNNQYGQDPTQEPWNLPGLWYVSSVQSLSLDNAVKYLDFYGYGVGSQTDPASAKNTIAAECGMAVYPPIEQ